MARGEYKGRPTTTVLRQSIYKIVEEVAKDEGRTVSKAIERLVEEALKARGYEIED